MKKKTLYTVLMITCVIGFWLFDNFYTPATYTEANGKSNSTEIPLKFIPSTRSGTIVHHQYFSLSYAERYEQAEWVAYKLTKEQLTYDDRKRPYFIEDPKVSSKSADWRNYRGSGYDRGHLCPAGDRRFSDYAYKETFYTSNISPQKNDFNAGIWNRLEQKVRYWAKRYKTVYVITGGVLEKGLPSIGEEDVAVPQRYYKILVKEDKGHIDVLAFLFPHKESTKPLQEFVVPVHRLEGLTGIDFFEAMPDHLQETLEKQSRIGSWKF
ncbi:DNA/RNA non-specific endonuclease [Spongiimicrobium salis]|uniref:DNA/RNA non-specific endonuclease n=1 Tax=Spongiimicrobium salis TaxID=1667022 RepID=UPI00374CD2DF